MLIAYVYPAWAGTEGRAVSEPDIRHYRAFVTVIDAGSFTAAATALHVTQPALSRMVAGLERLLGQQLIDRLGQPVRPTSAGAALLPHARRVLEVTAEAVSALDAQPSRLRVGFTWGGAGALTSDIVRVFEHSHPQMRVALRRFDAADAGVLDGRSHLALVRRRPRSARLDSAVLFEEPRLAAFPADHSRATDDHVCLADIAEDPLIVNTLSGTTSAALWPKPYAQRRIIEVNNTEEWLQYIALARGIGVTALSTGRFYTHPDVRYVPVVDAPPVPALAVWPTKGKHPAVVDFLAAADEVIDHNAVGAVHAEEKAVGTAGFEPADRSPSRSDPVQPVHAP